MTTPAGSSPAGGAGQIAEPVFSRVEDWLGGYFRPMFRRPLGREFCWCPRWWAHDEARSRLTALWRSWEAMRLEPTTGESDWYAAHLDHHLPILLSARGPFCQCSAADHLELVPFPAEPVDYDVLAAQPVQQDDSAAFAELIPDPVFSRAEDWVEAYFRPIFRRPLGGEFRWCARWWAHPEAVSRLTALWRTWEQYRLEPATGISDWYGGHLDHHLPILLGARGPFCQCSPAEHHPLRLFAVTPAPDGDMAAHAAAGDDGGTGSS